MPLLAPNIKWNWFNRSTISSIFEVKDEVLLSSSLHCKYCSISDTESCQQANTVRLAADFPCVLLISWLGPLCLAMIIIWNMPDQLNRIHPSHPGKERGNNKGDNLPEQNPALVFGTHPACWKLNQRVYLDSFLILLKWTQSLSQMYLSWIYLKVYGSLLSCALFTFNVAKCVSWKGAVTYLGRVRSVTSSVTPRSNKYWSHSDHG